MVQIDQLGLLSLWLEDGVNPIRHICLGKTRARGNLIQLLPFLFEVRWGDLTPIFDQDHREALVKLFYGRMPRE